MVRKFIVVMGIGLVMMAAPVFGDALFAPGDSIIAIDTDALRCDSGYPHWVPEGPAQAIDGTLTKYLNFGKENSGFIVTPSAASTMQSFVLTTANDSPERDPTSWELYGTNDAISSFDNTQGLLENWSLIGSGAVALPDTRDTVGPVVTVPNATSYSSYRMVFPTVKNPGATNSMQLAEAEFYASTDGSGSNLLAPTDAILAIHAAPGTDSEYPDPGEAPSFLVDGTLSKYLNFGRENCGFIITPSYGSSIVDSFEITTANDAEERDPTSWVLYGTNDPITSADNSVGDSETWTLIDSGSLSLPSERDTLGPLVMVDSDMEYTSYKMVFPSIKGPVNSNSIQIAEIQFYGVPEPATLCLLGLGGLGLVRRRRKRD